MFLYFIQRKRWLGNNPEFVEDFWRGYQDAGQAQNTFFDKWLRVLFFEAFNNKFHGGHTQFPQEIRDALALAPYLNGGCSRKTAWTEKPVLPFPTGASSRFSSSWNATISPSPKIAPGSGSGR